MSLYENIHKKRERIKRGSKERMKRKGEKGRPTAKDFENAAKIRDEIRRLEETSLKYADDPMLKQKKVRKKTRKGKK